MLNLHLSGLLKVWEVTYYNLMTVGIDRNLSVLCDLALSNAVKITLISIHSNDMAVVTFAIIL